MCAGRSCVVSNISSLGTNADSRDLTVDIGSGFPGRVWPRRPTTNVVERSGPATIDDEPVPLRMGIERGVDPPGSPPTAPLMPPRLKGEDEEAAPAPFRLLCSLIVRMAFFHNSFPLLGAPTGLEPSANADEDVAAVGVGAGASGAEYPGDCGRGDTGEVTGGGGGPRGDIGDVGPGPRVGELGLSSKSVAANFLLACLISRLRVYLSSSSSFFVSEVLADALPASTSSLSSSALPELQHHLNMSDTTSAACFVRRCSLMRCRLRNLQNL